MRVPPYIFYTGLRVSTAVKGMFIKQFSLGYAYIETREFWSGIGCH